MHVLKEYHLVMLYVLFNGDSNDKRERRDMSDLGRRHGKDFKRSRGEILCARLGIVIKSITSCDIRSRYSTMDQISDGFSPLTPARSWPLLIRSHVMRHPLALAQQVLALNYIAPARLRRQNLTLYFILYREKVKNGCTFLFFDVWQTEFVLTKH